MIKWNGDGFIKIIFDDTRVFSFTKQVIKGYRYCAI